jgi:predicted RNase H-like HicB family nuclease
MKFNITLDRDEDGVWIAECPSIPGCVSQGKTKQEAVESLKDAIALCLEVRAEKGLPLTIETPAGRGRGVNGFPSGSKRAGSCTRL